MNWEERNTAAARLVRAIRRQAEKDADRNLSYSVSSDEHWFAERFLDADVRTIEDYIAYIYGADNGGKN